MRPRNSGFCVLSMARIAIPSIGSQPKARSFSEMSRGSMECPTEMYGPAAIEIWPTVGLLAGLSFAGLPLRRPEPGGRAIPFTNGIYAVYVSTVQSITFAWFAWARF